ncbi:MAG: type IV pili twitching motility protein PilT, partial [Candidatus Sumerlaeota bacterium]|nr:type IV pili twitching motility protein PilT [Candidatus Sumerlaeota bacterium]
MPKIDDLFRVILDRGGSDLPLSQGQTPKMRLHGVIEKINDRTLDEEGLRFLLDEICPSGRWQRFVESGDLDFAYSLGDEARFRANYHYHANGFGAIFRLIPRD